MKITTDHPLSSYGVPVILDAKGKAMDYADGLKAVRSRLGMNTQQMGLAIGKSKRTVENYEQGRRMIPTECLYVLSELMGKAKA